MRQLAIGMLLGSLLTGGIGMAGQFYGKDRNVKTPVAS